MNYRHAFHAGNQADVLKHVVLVALVEALRGKDKPFSALDLHAGVGRYALAAEAAKTGEYVDGIARIEARDRSPCRGGAAISSWCAASTRPAGWRSIRGRRG